MRVGPLVPALPDALARKPRLDLSHWQIREVSLATQDITHATGHVAEQVTEQVVKQVAELDAVLIPLTPEAREQIYTLFHSNEPVCFLLRGNLFAIISSHLNFQSDDHPVLKIHCRSVWSQPAEQDSRKSLSARSLPWC